MKKWGPGLLLISLTLAYPPSPEGAGQTVVVLPSGAKIMAEVAESRTERLKGLMFRESLPDETGMLLVFEAPGPHGIWTKNCRIPLDIVWLDAERQVVHLEENVPPCKENPCPIYYPPQPALYVLELNAGSIHREKISKGIRIHF